MKRIPTHLVERLGSLDPSRAMIADLLSLAEAEGWGDTLSAMTLGELVWMWEAAKHMPAPPKRPRGRPPKTPRAAVPTPKAAVPTPKAKPQVVQVQPPAQTSPSPRPTALATKVLDFLLEEPWSTAQHIAEAIGAELTELTQVLAELVEKGEARTFFDADTPRYSLG